MQIKKLNINECELLKYIDRSDNIRAVWQTNENGVRSLEFQYLDVEGYGSQIETCIEILRNVVAQNGTVYGAFENNNPAFS